MTKWLLFSQVPVSDRRHLMRMVFDDNGGSEGEEITEELMIPEIGTAFPEEDKTMKVREKISDFDGSHLSHLENIQQGFHSQLETLDHCS